MSVCVICNQIEPMGGRGTPKVQGIPGRDAHTIECIRCGKYDAEHKLRLVFPHGLPADTGLVLSSLARERTTAGERLSLTVANHKELASTAPPPLGYSETIDRVLLAFADACRYPGSFTGAMEIEPLAARFCLPSTAFADLVQLLSTDGLLNVASRDALSVGVGLTPKGWERVDRLQSVGPRSRHAFVAMWFDEQVKAAFDDGIRPALVECGFESPFRVDELEPSRPALHEPRIDDRIIARIRRARIVIADVTGARPAVYYEAGFAAALGIPVIWCCRRDKEMTDMCFDTRQFEHILWDSPDQLKDSLVQKIRAHAWAVPGGGSG